MKRLDDQKIRDAFSENEEIPIVQEFEKENIWRLIERQMSKRKKIHLNWYRSVAAVLVLVILSGWSVTLLKYNQIKIVNKQLNTTVKAMESVLELQKIQIAESPAKPVKKQTIRAENKKQLPEKSIGDDLLLSENKKLRSERESLVSKNNSLYEKLNILSLENNRWADSLRLVTEMISESKELPTASIETPREPDRQNANKAFNTHSSIDKTEVYITGLEDKHRGGRLRIQLFDPGEPVENNPANEASIFKLFK